MAELTNQPTTLLDLAISPGITSPIQNTAVDFNEPLKITWESKGHEVIRFYLRVGTSDGRWDLFSAEVGKRINSLLLDISVLPADVERLYLKLAYTQMVNDKVKVTDRKTKELIEHDIVEEVEMEPEEPLVIYRKNKISLSS
jgi:hypothetical protein